MAYRKFDTCFFERYAQLTLSSVLGNSFDSLVNKDRPDLQTPDNSLGIEVTRAMEPHRHNANQLLKELAGMVIDDSRRDDLEQIVKSGYAYGLPGLNYTGYLEHQYWALALPLKRIITSKVEKVAKGFYGDFKEHALYIFCRDLLDLTQVENAVTFTLLLQDNLDIRFKTLYLSQTDTLYVCNLADNLFYEGIRERITPYLISNELRRELFFKALGY